MKRSPNFRLPGRVLALAAVVAVVASGSVLAQPTGNIYVQTMDTEGARLPGVTVTLSGMGAPTLFVTDAKGEVRFLGLDPGVHQIKAELEGFGTVEYPSVEVRIGRNTSIELTMSAAIEEVITVTSESPLLDERRLSTGTTVTALELEKIPTARDPWAVMSQTPGVILDRINVGGNESGQQSSFRSQGVSGEQNDFLIDGVQITDMSALGASPTYYDFDQFAEIALVTGGNDVSKNVAGLSVNMVTKRGTNEFRGSARFFKTQARGYFGGALSEGSLDVADEICTTGCNNVQEPEDYVGNQLNGIEDIGFEAGGPALRDKVWLWGAWAKNDIRTIAASGDPDNTILENTSIKINAQFSSANSFVASYNNGDKVKAGRGAGPTRSAASLWDQRGPSAISRFEDTQVFSSNFFLTGQYSIVDLGFELVARGDVGTNGLDPAATDPSFDENGVWQDNFLTGKSKRPGDEFKLDGSYFFNTGNTSHELKVGGRFRTVEGTELFSWGPRNIFHTYWGTDVARHSQTGPSTNEYASLWAQDTMTFGNFTINVGFRYDNQSGSNDEATIGPHALFPEALPSFTVAAGTSSLTWSDVTPRIGVTYALGEERKTLLRGSFSQYVDQMGVGYANWESPVYYGWYAYFYDGDLYAATYFDPLNPSVSPNRFADGFSAPRTSELILGVEHAFLPEFLVSAGVTYRQVTDLVDVKQNLRDGSGGIRAATPSDYTLISQPTGNIPRSGETYTVDFFDLVGQPDVLLTADGTPSGGETVLNGPREREFLGGTVSFTKRLANNWMARGYVTYGDADLSVPTSMSQGGSYIGCPNGYANNWRGGGCEDGDTYVTRETGSGKPETYLQATWAYNLNGMYQVAPDRRWGFNLSGNLTGREGYPVPYYDRSSSTAGSMYINVVGDPASIRLKNISTLDLRIEKEFALHGPISLTFGIDLFNATNNNDGLGYQVRTNTGNAGFLLSNVSPRIWRLGVRLNWR